MDFLREFVFAFWFFGPAGIANVLAFFSGKIPSLKKYNYPVDFNLKFRNRRILGDHKTIRGFVCGIIGSVLIVYLEIFLYEHLEFVRQLILMDYSRINPLLLGVLAGFGALAGDAVESFFKRQMGIASGKSWFPFDQIDYIIGGVAFTALYIKLTVVQYIFIFVMWFLIHPFATFIGYLLKLKKEPL